MANRHEQANSIGGLLVRFGAIGAVVGFMLIGPIVRAQEIKPEIKVDVPSKQDIQNGRTAFIHLQNQAEIMKTAPRLPLVEGCYKLASTWQKTPCTTKEENAKYPHPEYLPAISYSKAKDAGDTPPMPVTGGGVDIRFSLLGSEKDSKYGSNYWSIQANTNGFIGNDGQKDWVQFADQYVPNKRDHVCIWVIEGINTRNPDYNTYTECLDVDHPREVRTGDYASIEAYEDFDLATESAHYLLMRVYLSWDSDTTMYGITAKDEFGLTQPVNNVGPWTEMFGSILGYGWASTANFSKSTLDVMVETLGCKWEAATGCEPNPGPWTWSATRAFTKLSAGTGEQNNLQPTVNYGPTTKNKDLPALNCSMEYACYIAYTGTAP